MTNIEAKPTDAGEVRDLARDLARLYVGRPGGLRVEFQESEDGNAYFAMKGDPADDARLIGKVGTHVDSLKFLIGRIGELRGKVYNFRLITNSEGKSVFDPPRDALTFDPEPARAVLARAVEAVGVPRSEVKAGPGSGPRSELAFVYDVVVPDKAWLREMTVSHGGELTLAAALGTLYRAIGRQNGVKVQINVKTP